MIYTINPRFATTTPVFAKNSEFNRPHTGLQRAGCDNVTFGHNPQGSSNRRGSHARWLLPLLMGAGFFGYRACNEPTSSEPRFAPIETPVDAIDSALVFNKDWRWLDDFSRFWADAEGLGYNSKPSDKSLMGITGVIKRPDNTMGYWSDDHRTFHNQMKALYPAYTQADGIKNAPKAVQEKAYRLLERFMYKKSKALQLDTIPDENTRFMLLEINNQIGSGFTEKLLKDMRQRKEEITPNNLLQNVWQYRNGSHPTLAETTNYDYLSLGDGRLRRNLLRWAAMEDRGESMEALTAQPRELKVLRRHVERLRRNGETLTAAMNRITGNDATLMSLLNHGNLKADTLRWLETRHVWQPDETLASVAKTYNLTPQDLELANPKSSMEPGHLVRIPVTGVTAKANPKRWYHFLFSPGSETLKDIANREGVSKKAILKLNPTLPYSDNLPEGTVVALPRHITKPTVVKPSTPIKSKAPATPNKKLGDITHDQPSKKGGAGTT